MHGNRFQTKRQFLSIKKTNSKKLISFRKAKIEEEASECAEWRNLAQDLMDLRRRDLRDLRRDLRRRVSSAAEGGDLQASLLAAEDGQENQVRAGGRVVRFF